MLAVGLRPVLWKLLLMVILQWCTSPLSGHMLAQFEYRVNQNLEQHLALLLGKHLAIKIQQIPHFQIFCHCA